jgi:hypothetical protein
MATSVAILKGELADRPLEYNSVSSAISGASHCALTGAVGFHSGQSRRATTTGTECHAQPANLDPERPLRDTRSGRPIAINSRS